MRCLMAKNQRDYILSHVQEHLLEWGCGGTTLYFLQNLKGKKLTSIEHHPEWYAKVKEVCDYDNHDFHLIEGQHIGNNATPFEENPSGLHDYISFDAENVDTVLVDGVARSVCLTMAYIKYPNATVFLHDANRDWYNYAINLYPNKKIIAPEEGGYPPLLIKLWR